MIFINLAVILLYIMLAILSRKNFSKYKNPFYAMAMVLYDRLSPRVNSGGIKSRLRKLHTVSESGLFDLTRDYMVKNAAVCLCSIFVFNLIAGAVCIADKNAPDGANTIEREDYQGNTREYDIYMNIDGETAVYTLGVEPVQYTEEEFYEQADCLFEWLEREMLGENEDAGHIYQSLLLPTEDENGVFRISWSSDRPDMISSYGRIQTDTVSEDVAVVMSARVSYLEYSVWHDFPVLLKKTEGNVGDSKLDITGQTLNMLESDNRSKKTLTIPRVISGVEISLQKDKGSRQVHIMLLGLAVCIASVLIRAERLKDLVKRRDSMLIKEYPAFVNRICLLLETGMTMRNVILQIVDETDASYILNDELSYTLHELDAGADEAAVYERLGLRLGLMPYTRLMQHISRNLRLGTRDLLSMMEEEAQASMEARREYARKKGEEASAKLVFPMIILLAAVMVIIIVPALLSF